MSLIARAKELEAQKPKSTANPLTDEQLDFFVAYAKGDVMKLSVVFKVFKESGIPSANPWIMVREAVKRGKLVVPAS